jgi:class 3 adenylate cyclase
VAGIRIKSKNYAEYCRVHAKEFKDVLRDEAGLSLISWQGRTAAALLVLASMITFYDANVLRDNPLASYTIFTYSIPIAIIIFYPVVSFFASTITKHAPRILDLLGLAGLLGFCFNVYFVTTGANSQSQLEEVSFVLQGQIAFVLALSMAFAFHASFYITLAKNLLFTIIAGLALFYISRDFAADNLISIVEGLFLGTIIGWVFYDAMRTRFYLKSTDADTRQHLYNQLSKLVYPHQLERIKLGDQLENTMPLKEGKAIINVFDVQKSSAIRHENTQDFFMGVFQAFLQICMKGYEHNPLRSRAFRLKETGDGFISAVGYPFLPVDSRSLADSAVATALLMFEAFNVEVRKFNYSRPIKAAMGLAYNSVQGTFQSGGIRSYDLFGDALIQASKYEELRKQPALWKIFTSHAASLGLEDFNILIVQEVVYNSLSPSYRDVFVEIALDGPELLKTNFEMMYDNGAKFIYFHVLE